MKLPKVPVANLGWLTSHTVFVEGALSPWFEATYSECNFWLTGHGPARIEGCNGPLRLDEMYEPGNTLIEGRWQALFTLCPPVTRENGSTRGQSVNNAQCSQEV